MRNWPCGAQSPLLVGHLFRELHGHLLELLRSLSAQDWHRPTVCSAWCVKDIASHLLDGDLRRLSIQRDGYLPPTPRPSSNRTRPLWTT